MKVFPEYGDHFEYDSAMWWLVMYVGVQALMIWLQLVSLFMMLYRLWDQFGSMGSADAWKLATHDILWVLLAIALLMSFWAFLISRPFRIAWRVTYVLLFLSLIWRAFGLAYLAITAVTAPSEMMLPLLPPWVWVLWTVVDAAIWVLIFFWWSRRRSMYGVGPGWWGRALPRAA